jgi:hypothetical protein
VGNDFASSNRYLANAAVPLVITFLPACAATVRGLQARWPTVLGRWRPLVAALLPPALVVVAWLSGLGALRDYRAGFVTTHRAIRHAARSASIIARDGCPFGTTLDLGALVIGPPSPQLTTALVAELTRKGALDPPLDEAPDPAVVERICRPN